MESQKSPYSQSKLKKNKAGCITSPDFKTYLQGYSNQNSMALA